MKAVMTANILIKITFIICVTILAIIFQKIGLLWWFLLTPILGYEYKNNKANNQNEQGGAE